VIIIMINSIDLS